LDYKNYLKINKTVILTELSRTHVEL